MVVRLVVMHRRGTAILFPGAVLELADAEAMVLVQDGVAVPVAPPREPVGKETR